MDCYQKENIVSRNMKVPIIKHLKVTVNRIQNSRSIGKTAVCFYANRMRVMNKKSGITEAEQPKKWSIWEQEG